MVLFCMSLKRMTTSIDPVFLQPSLKSGGTVDVIKVLDRQPISIEVGECKTVCWQFSKPDDLDLDCFYEYTDIENDAGLLVDFIWRTDMIEGFTSNQALIPTKPVETMAWPLFNVWTKTMATPMPVITAVDMSNALPGWQVVDMSPPLGSSFTLHPGTAPVGSITIRKPDHLDEGVSVIRPQLINAATGEIVQEVYLRFKIDHTPPKVVEAGAESDGENGLFRVTAVDAQSGVADAIEVHISVNGGPFESFYLDPFQIPPAANVFITDSPCRTCVKPMTVTTTLGPFGPAARIRYYFTVPDEAGNTTTTAPATMQVPGVPISNQRIEEKNQ